MSKKPKVRVRTVTTTDRKVTKTFGRDAVRGMIEAELGHKLPPDARVLVEVPGGGDWSGMDLDVGEDAPLRVEWTEHDEKVEETET